MVEAGRRVGLTVAESVFGDRDYGNRLDRQLATGAAAVGELVVEEALTVALGHSVLRLSLVPEVPSPVWPGRADGSGEAAAVVEVRGDADASGGTDVDDGGPDGTDCGDGGDASAVAGDAAPVAGRRPRGGAAR